MAKISSFGLFWRRDEIEWEPGRGNANTFRLLGRIGVKRPSRRICDFRLQQGIYILYNDYGPVYTGLSGRRGNGSALGQRLKEHTTDHLKDGWTRFSWFGFDPISAPSDDGICSVENAVQLDENTPVSASIRDTEALIINILKPSQNQSVTKFTGAERWHQVNDHEIKSYLGK